MHRFPPPSQNRPPSRPFHLTALAILWAALLLPCHAWRPSLYPANWTPPESASFATDKLIQDFSYAGYRRGEEPVPKITGPVFDVTSYGAQPGGAGDSTTAIQNAINAAAAAGGGVVFLPAGIYRVAPQGGESFALRIGSSNIVLRGAGAGQSFILNTSFEMRAKAVIRVTPPSTPLGPEVAITANLDNPTRRIPVANASAFNVGDMVRMHWTFTQGWIDEHNQGNWWSDPSPRPAPAEYAREVTAVNPGDDWIEVDVPTRYTMKTRDNARIRRVGGQLSGVGIEDISIGNIQHPGSNHPNDGWGEGDYELAGRAAWDAHASWLITMSNTYDSWITGVRSYQAAGNTSTCHMLSNGISLVRCFRVTVANCQMRRSQYGGGGGNGYLFRVQSSHDNLIRDSIADFSRHGLVISHAGTSGNVFLRCEDRETKRSTGSSGSYSTNGAGSDNHMHFSHSNLFDRCQAHNSFYTAHHRGNSGTTPHGLTSAHAVYWNTSGSGTREAAVVRSEQGRYGYVIGTSGTRPSVTNTTGGNTAPADHVEGVNMGTTMEPQSLYLDQLSKRMQGIMIDAGENSLTGLNSAFPLNGSIYTYGSDPVTSLWTQISGPATAVFADASSPTTTVALPEPGSYLLKLSATDGNKSGAAQVVIEVAVSTPRSAAHFIRGEAQNTSLDPPGYYTSASNIIGTSGSSGRRDDRNVVLRYTLPTLPVGTTLESAKLGFEITGARDSTGANNLPELQVYLMDSVNPAASGLAFFHHGTSDNSPDVKRVGTTSVTISGNEEQFFAAGEQTRLITLDGDALAMLQGFYNGHQPTRSTVYFRFNLSLDPSMNDFRRYRINNSADGSALYLEANAIPSVNAGPNQTITLSQSPPWTPAQLATAAWYDASDPSSMTVQSGNTVSEWRDKSGNNNHAAQATAAARPTTGTATIGGLNAIALRIGGATNKQFLTAPDHASLNLDSSGGVNVFAIMKYLGYVDNGSGLNAAFSKGQILNAQSAYGIRVGNDNALGYQAGSNGQVNTTDFTNQEILYAGTGNFSASSAQLFINGRLRSTTNPSGAFTSNNTASLHIGRDDSTVRHADVDLGEILLVGGVLTADERRKTEGYLAHKWGMAGELPANHPYKDAAPVNPEAFAIAALNGSATDVENDPLTFSWSVVSGPGDVIFANPSAPGSTASFSSVGRYVLRLTVGDGISINSDDVTITVEVPAAEPKTYDVYLVAGQSNADGRGYTSDLTGGLAAYAGTQENAKIFYVNPANGNPDNPTHNTGWMSLAPGYSVAPGFSGSLPSDRFGFEVSLGKALAAQDPDRNIAIIKISRGGTSLANDWAPTGGANYMWQTLTSKLPEALAALTAGGDTAEIRGMFWHQGESDGSNPTYQSNLVEFIAAVRTLTGRPDLPFAIGELERDDFTPTVSGRTYQLTAMANLAATDPDTIVVSSADLLTYDGTHFTSPAYITFGERFAAAFHDYEQGLKHTVTYHGNGSTCGNVPVDSTSYNSVASATVLGAGGLMKSEAIFSGWNTSADGSGTGYSAGSVLIITADTSLHAQWLPKISPSVDPWPVAAPITEGQPLSSSSLSGGGASVPGSFAFTHPSMVLPTGISAAEVTFTPSDTTTYNPVHATVNITVRTAFESWAGNEDLTFTGDANSDGVTDGIAWLLGAADPTQNARVLLPAATGKSGSLEAGFTIINQPARGAAVLNLQYCTDLGTWTTVPIPEMSGTHGEVEFSITPNGTLNNVVATIPSSAASANRLFIRLSGAEN